MEKHPKTKHAKRKEIEGQAILTSELLTMERQTKPPINPKTIANEKGEKKSENYHGLCLHQNKRKDKKRKEKHTSKRKRWKTPLHGSPEKSYSQQSARNEWLEVFSEKVKESFLGKEKKKKNKNKNKTKQKKEKWRSFKSKPKTTRNQRETQ